MSELAVGYVSIVPKLGKGFADGINKGIGGAGDSGGREYAKGFGGSLKGAIGALGLVAAGAAVGKALFSGIKESVGAASELEQSVGGLQAVFGQSFGEMDKAAKGAAQSLGMTQDSYNKMATTLGAGLKNKGIDDFAGQTQNLIKLGGDLAAQYGGSTSDAVSAISALMRGEADPIEKYGVGINDVAIKAELAAKGQDKLTGAALESAKAQARLDILMRQTTDAHGAFSRENDTLANKMERSKAAWGNITAQIGGLFLPVVSSVAGVISDKVLPAIQNLVGGLETGTGPLAGLFADLKAGWDGFVAGFGGMDALTSTFSALIPLLTGPLGILKDALVGVFSSEGGGIDFAAFGTTIGTVLGQILPIIGELATAITGGLTAGLMMLIPALMQAGEQLLPVIMEAFRALAPVVTTVVGLITQLIPPIMQLVTSLMPPLAAIIELVVAVVVKLAEALVPVIKTIVERLVPPIMSLIDMLLPPLIKLVTWLAENLMTVLGPAIDIVAGILVMLIDVIGKLIDWLGKAIDWVVKFAKSLPEHFRNMGSSIGETFDKIGGFFTGLYDGAVKTLGNVVDFFRGVPGNILGALGDLGNLLVGSGSALLDGFRRGIDDAFRGVVDAVKSGLDWVRGFFPFSPAKRGPFSGSGYTTYSGKAMMSDFAASITGQQGTVRRALARVMGTAQTTLNANIGASGTGAARLGTTNHYYLNAPASAFKDINAFMSFFGGLQGQAHAAG